MYNLVPKKYKVYQYQYIDYNALLQPPEDVYKRIQQEIEEMGAGFADSDWRWDDHLKGDIEKIKKIFLDNGWDGDGDLGIIWVPPFMMAGIEGDSHPGFILWHVKQFRNGTSFILSTIRIPHLED